jgi:Right handed beta helix region
MHECPFQERINPVSPHVSLGNIRYQRIFAVLIGFLWASRGIRCCVAMCVVGPSSNKDLLASLNDLTCSHIWIEKGLYNITQTVMIERPVRITGESKDETVLTFRGAGSFILVINTVNVTVERLTIDASSHEAWEAFGAFNSSLIKLSDTIILGSSNMFAVFFAGPYVAAGQPTIDAFEASDLDSDNIVENNAIYQESTLDVLSFSLQKNGRVTGNTVVGGVISFFMNKDSKCTDNTVLDSLTQGIYLSVPAENNIISRNNIRNSTSAGIKVSRQIDHLDENTGEIITPTSYRASGIVVKDNTIVGSSYFGIEVAQTVNAVVKSNLVQNSSLTGIYSVFNDGMMVKQNTIEGFGYYVKDDFWSKLNSGFFGDAETMDSQIMRNVFDTGDANGAVHGILINKGLSQSGNVIQKNLIRGNFTGYPISVSSEENIVKKNAVE